MTPAAICPVPAAAGPGRVSCLLAALVLLPSCLPGAARGEIAPASWRSRLYPEGRLPGAAGEEAFFLHDFSTAGYLLGERQPPERVPGVFLDATREPWGADPEGRRDSTAAIQAALEAAGEAGGGTVYLPPGTYLVRPGEDRSEALLLSRSGVVLRGAGPGRTFIYNTEPAMRRRAVIAVRPARGFRSWQARGREEVFPLARDAATGESRLETVSVEGLAPGDWVLARSDLTADFLARFDPGLERHWLGRLPGPVFLRRIISLDPESRAVIIDIPLRHRLATADRARLEKIEPPLERIGLEDFSLAMEIDPGPGFGARDYLREGTGAWRVHGSHAIVINWLGDGWVRRVETGRPPDRPGPFDISSNGIQLLFSGRVTLSECRLGRARYRGEGGNGYGFVIQAGDCLLRECSGEELRYAFSFKGIHSTGNVILGGESRATSDFHMHLSAANLVDGLLLSDGGVFRARWRGTWGTVPHALTTHGSVFWNIRGEGRAGFLDALAGSPVIDCTGQSGRILVVGTSGERFRVAGLEERHRETHLEGEGLGAGLLPPSLYLDQLDRRLSVPGRVPLAP